MNDEELFYTIAIGMIPDIGAVLSKNLIAYAGSAKSVFDLPLAKLEKVPGVGQKTAHQIAQFQDFKRAERQLEYIKKQGSQILRFNDRNYPNRLRRNADAPLLLYYRGNADLNHGRVINIVGTRKCSEESKAFTEEFVKSLKCADCLIVSGLAYGIDIHAHKAAVKYGIPTVGVVAHGLDILYPATHSKVVEEMYQNGGVLTEYSIETKPDRENFPTRNRIVAGMCDATIVIESPIKGGAMITANLAHSYDRDVFAIPGKPGESRIAGNHYLIKKNKAALLESADDLLEYMGWEQNAVNKPIQLNLELTSGESHIMQLFDEQEKWMFDDLNLRISSSNLSLNLLELEMKGLIRSLPGNIYKRAMRN